MQFKQNAKVVSADGETVAQVDRVVVDPRNMEVTHLVVKEGLVLTEDRVIPVDMVESAGEEEVRLSVPSGALEELPHYEETAYVAPGDSTHNNPNQYEIAPLVYAYPPAMGATIHSFTGEYPGAGTQLSSEKTTPAHTVAIESGARVVTAEGEELGSISQVLIDPQSNQMSHIVVARGMLQSNKLVPAGWIGEMTEDSVQLAVDSRVLDRLQDYSD